ncbi:hypothetical protein BC941DRAFT_191717 [Chlamydoabsidia padenii]|nr:hypothetical protein BC941DRAFT_191717 [Chlamydoabsidia padenii]
MINSNEVGIIKVNSFSPLSDEVYTITLDEEDKNVIVSCTSYAFVRNGTRCKHMFLVNRMDRILFPTTLHQPPLPHSANQQRMDEFPQMEHQAQLDRAITILNTNNTRLQDLNAKTPRYGERAAQKYTTRRRAADKRLVDLERSRVPYAQTQSPSKFLISSFLSFFYF